MNALAIKLHRQLVMADKETNAIPVNNNKETIAYSIHRMQDAQYLASLMEYDIEFAAIETVAMGVVLPELHKNKLFDKVYTQLSETIRNKEKQNEQER